MEIPTVDELNDMSEGRFKAVENKARRMAERQGLRLEKSRRRDPRATTYGTYWLVDLSTNTIAAGDVNNGYGMNLDDVYRALIGDDQ